LRGIGYEKRCALCAASKKWLGEIPVSIPLRGIGYEKPYTYETLTTNSFQSAFAPSY
jgi:hypothetical protein